MAERLLADAGGGALIWRLNQLGIDRILVVDDLGSSEKWRNLAPLTFSDYVHKNVFAQWISSGNVPVVADAIVHLGACSTTTEKNVDYLAENNYRYSKYVAEWALANHVRLIYASSAATYGDGQQGYRDDESLASTLLPLNPYGYSKQLFDLWAIRSGVMDRMAGLKFFNVFGPNEYHKGSMTSAVFNSFHQIGANGNIKLFKSGHPNYADGQQKRDFVYIKDCVEVMAWLLDNPSANGLFNVGTGVARSWLDLAHAVFAAMGKTPSIEFVDMPATLSRQYQYFTQADMRKLQGVGCPVKFRTLEEGVSDYVQNYLATDMPYLSPARPNRDASQTEAA